MDYADFVERFPTSRVLGHFGFDTAEKSLLNFENVKVLSVRHFFFDGRPKSQRLAGYISETRRRLHSFRTVFKGMLKTAK